MTDAVAATDVRAVAQRARTASRALAVATRAEKDAALLAMADDLEAATDAVLAANAEDVERAEAAGTSANILDRLRLS
ncbi:MAG: glutamate-5-semialdehyde dehydrogenase, partial [Nocardioides sp.]